MSGMESTVPEIWPGSRHWRKSFRGLSFGNRDLSECEFFDCDFTDASFNRTNLFRSRFNKCNFENANFDGSKMFALRTALNYGSPQSLAKGWIFFKGFMVGPGVSLVGINLRSANLIGADLSGADLRNAFIESADFDGSILQDVRAGGLRGNPASLPKNWKVISGHFVGPNADLKDVDFSGGDFRAANLEGTELHNAVLDNIRSGNIVGTPMSLPPNWELKYGYLLGPKVCLAGEELSDMDLSGLDLNEADLGDTTISRVNFSKANLFSVNFNNSSITDSSFDHANLGQSTFTRVHSSGVSGLPSNLPEGLRLTNGYFIGSNSRLEGSNFRGLDLRNEDMSFSSLRGACFCDSKLDWANLSNSDLGGSCFDRVDLSTTSLTNARVEGARLGESKIVPSDSPYKKISVSGNPDSLPANCQMSKGFLLAFSPNTSGEEEY